jgi:hypothetical protein
MYSDTHCGTAPLNGLYYIVEVRISGEDPGGGGKNMIFWRKIVIFHTKYPNKYKSGNTFGSPQKLAEMIS